MTLDCLECRQEFSSQKGLHLHLKKHGGMAGYYQKHYPRRDWFDDELIFFENADQYLSSIFNSHDNRVSFLKNCSEQEGKDAIKIELSKEIKEKHNDYFPSQNYLVLSELADIRWIKKFYGSVFECAKELKINQRFNQKLPKGFFSKDVSSLEVLIDTREQKPYSYSKSIQSKLDFGDYAAGGEFYSKTFVDRKSINDFKGTFGVGYERFCNEIERAKSFQSFIFVVVEGTIEGIKQQNEKTKFKTNLSYSFHNVREILRKYDNIQFLFCNGREKGKELTQRVLYFGDELWNCDLQYYLDYGIH